MTVLHENEDSYHSRENRCFTVEIVARLLDSMLWKQFAEVFRFFKETELGCVSLLDDVHFILKFFIKITSREYIICIVFLLVCLDFLKVNKLWVLSLKMTFHKHQVIFFKALLNFVFFNHKVEA
jgi:hypothetical protein